MPAPAWCNRGFGLSLLVLQNVMRFKWNHKCAYQKYWQFELNLRLGPKKRIGNEKLEQFAVPMSINRKCSEDFRRNSFEGGNAFRLLNVFVDCTAKGLASILTSHCRTSGWFETWIKSSSGTVGSDPFAVIMAQNTPVPNWKRGAQKHDAKLLFIQPRNPRKNVVVVRYNRTRCY